MEVRVENTRKIAVIVGKRGVGRQARRHLRPRKVAIVHLAGAQDHREERSDILGVEVVLLVLIDLADR